MDNNTKNVLDFIKKMHLKRQGKLFQLKKINLEINELEKQKTLCRQGIQSIEAKIKSEVLTNPDLRAKFSLDKNEVGEEDDGVGDEWKN